MSKYYNNMEVKVVAELPNDESVIEFITGMYYDRDEFQEYAEPIVQRLVVSNSSLADMPIIKDSIIEEKELMIKEVSKLKYEMLSEANKAIRLEYNELKDKVKELTKLMDDIYKNSEYAKTAKKWKNGDYKYVVGYGYELMTVDDFIAKMKNKSLNEDYADWENFYVKLSNNELFFKNSAYSNESYKLFETLEESKSHITETIIFRLNSKNIGIHLIKIAIELNLSIPIEYKELVKDLISKHNEKVNKENDRYKEIIEDNKNNLIESSSVKTTYIKETK